MKTIKATEGTPYDAAKHFGVYGLKKITEDQSKRIAVFYSYFQPNGSAEMSSSDKERVYYVVSGSITVNGKNEKHVLDPGDLIYIAPGEERDMVSSTWTPSVDIFETDKALVLTAEIPGIEENDIEIKIEDNTLTLKGERKFEKETKEENYHRIERAYGSFYRSFSLPHYIDQDKIEAEHKGGVLKITMPKKKELEHRKVKILKANSKPTKKAKK